MGTVSRVHTFASGAILTAAQLNNEFDNLLTSSAINGGLDATNLGVTAGQATASKALVVDASRNLADATGSNRINNLALSGTFESTGAITATAGITSGGNIVSDTDSTDDLGTTGVRWANLFVDDITVTNNVTIGGTLTLTGGITLNGNTTIGDSSADTLTVNSTITSNLIFTDNTYDIGASGATRPRNLYLSGNGVVGGTLGVTGLITASGGVSGTTGTFSGDVAVNTSTLKVDTGNNRVGVKNASPSYPLDIGYTAGINQVAWRGSTNEIGFLTYGSSTDAGAVQLSSGGAAKILFDAAGNSYINTGSNFGINTASPQGTVHAHLATDKNIRLQVIGAYAAIGALNDASSGYVQLNLEASDLVVGQYSGGNMGLGVVPSTWRSTETALQVDRRAALYADSHVTTALANNLIINSGGYALIEADAASQYYQYQGAHVWQTVGSGSAGANVSPSTVMSLTSAGLLGINTSSPKGLVDIDSTGRNAVADLGDADDYALVIRNPTTTGHGNGICFTNDDAVHVGGAIVHIDQGSNNTGDLAFYTRDTGGNVDEAMRIDNAQNLLVGGTSQSGTANRAAVFSANKFGLSIIDTTAQATGVGGALNLGGNYRSAGDAQAFARIEAVKENATDANYAYGMAFSTTPNGGTFSEGMRLDSSGRVGIGTSPSHTLDVNGSMQIERNGSSPLLRFTDTSSSSRWIGIPDGSSRFAIYGTNGSTEELVLDASGNMGLGVAPVNDTKLHIQNSATSRYGINVKASNGNNLFGVWEQPSGDGHLYLRNSSGTAIVRFAADTASSDHYISSGKLGIGTVSPACRTHIRESALSGFTPDSNTNLAVEENSTSLIEIAGTDSGILFSDASAWAGRIFYTHSSDQMAFATAQSNKMYIDNAGGVGVGVTPYANYRLSVRGATDDDTTHVLQIENSSAQGMLAVRGDGRISTGARTTSPYNNTTASAANMYVDSSGILYRSTSSAKYKTGVETIEDSYADAILNMRPVWYRSLSEADNANHGWWGFIAEEVAEIDPRLVQYRTTESVISEESGREETVTLDEPMPEGVSYDRFVPLLLNLIQRQQQSIETLETKVAALEAA